MVRNDLMASKWPGMVWETSRNSPGGFQMARSCLVPNGQKWSRRLPTSGGWCGPAKV